MSDKLIFKAYLPSYKDDCLALFDDNCPEFFAPNERNDYAAFLDSNPVGYEVCLVGDTVIGAFGLIGDVEEYKHINWILISSKSQGLGIGSRFIDRAIQAAKKDELQHIKIAASHLSAPFFAKYGARVIREIPHGWGANMHRIDMELHL
ncbi:GNAT family N-acetyltransferase [Litorilituus lipolyticus]|uniref:N-acetyltransferase n=1 Tax=Litorilituus lipolyticus TaxID=2491017 RepID=A0A502KT42_9GAMM|nr:GNAT family N-acetyltransferase [Litorilituus lipolyticus]TPH13579.1 N-acetyltransferase [Litorilituus lipolyticus]